MITTTTHTTQVAGVTLEERHTVVGIAFGRGGFGGAYRRPVAATHSRGSVPVRDVVFAARLIVLAAVAVALTIRRLTS